mmetsp:Transcript_4433/g.10211  ORF Transcript_4433/g.10211 Transcript_4433/m.10211 type:complete len:262 (-) Transcript_4433:46-831(-)
MAARMPSPRPSSLPAALCLSSLSILSTAEGMSSPLPPPGRPPRRPTFRPSRTLWTMTGPKPPAEDAPADPEPAAEPSSPWSALFQSGLGTKLRTDPSSADDECDARRARSPRSPPRGDGCSGGLLPVAPPAADAPGVSSSWTAPSKSSTPVGLPPGGSRACAAPGFLPSPPSPASDSTPSTTAATSSSLGSFSQHGAGVRRMTSPFSAGVTSTASRPGVPGVANCCMRFEYAEPPPRPSGDRGARRGSRGSKGPSSGSPSM